MGEEDAREQRIRRRGQFDRRGAPRALDVAPGNHHQGVERRRLDRQPCAGVALAGQLALEELGVIGVAAAERVERRQAREQVDTALAIAHLGQRVEQPALRVGQARVEGDGGELREHPPAVVAGRVLLQRALEVRRRGVRRPAARRGGRGVDQQPAHLRVGLRAALEQVAGHDVGVGATGHQRARGVAVHALARGSGEVLLDRGGDQAVGQALAVGPEQAGGQQRVAGRGQLADGDAGDGRHDVRERAVAEDRQRGRHRPLAGRQRGQAPADDVAGDGRDGRRVDAGAIDHLGAVGRDLPPQLAQQPRIAADRSMAVAAHGRRGLGRHAADELRRAAGCQPLRVQHDGRPRAAEQAQQVRRRARVVDAAADGDEQRQVVDTPRQVGEHLERGAVGPLGVVDHQGERALLGQRGA